MGAVGNKITDWNYQWSNPKSRLSSSTEDVKRKKKLVFNATNKFQLFPEAPQI